MNTLLDLMHALTNPAGYEFELQNGELSITPRHTRDSAHLDAGNAITPAVSLPFVSADGRRLA